MIINSKEISKLLFGTTFVNLCWPQAEIWLIYIFFADFLQKIRINIHEYTNELIWILEYQLKERAMSKL